MKQSEWEGRIRSARPGAPQALEALIRDIRNRACYRCKKMMNHESGARDAARDVLTAVLTGLDKRGEEMPSILEP